MQQFIHLIKLKMFVQIEKVSSSIFSSTIKLSLTRQFLEQ